MCTMPLSVILLFDTESRCLDHNSSLSVMTNPGVSHESKQGTNRTVQGLGSVEIGVVLVLLMLAKGDCGVGSLGACV